MPRGRPPEREMAFGVAMDFEETMRLLRSARLSRGRKDTEAKWAERLVNLVRQVWSEARFISCNEWRCSEERWDWVNHVPESLSIPRQKDETITRGETPKAGPPGTSLQLLRNGWRSTLPDTPEIRKWIMKLAPRNLGASRRKLLAARIVAWRWRLTSADAVLSKRIAQRRTRW